MRTIIHGCLALMLSLSTISGIAQSAKERQEILKSSKKELNEKASKDARKQAKKLEKEGWKTTPGALPLEKQLDRSFVMEYQFDEDGFPAYITGEAMSTGGNYDAAKMQAFELAKQNLVGKIQSEISALIESTVANEQLNDGDVQSLTESVMAGKNFMKQSIGRVITMVESYRVVNGKYEVQVRIAYSQSMAKSAAKKAIKKELEDQGNSLHEKLDELLGW